MSSPFTITFLAYLRAPVFAIVVAWVISAPLSAQAPLGNQITGVTSGAQFGWSVATSHDGHRIAVGIPGERVNAPGAGQVKVYDLVGTAWTQAGADIDGRAFTDFLGRTVALSADGSRLAIGAPQNGGNGKPGFALVYDYDGSNWNLVGDTIRGTTAEGGFGVGIDLSDDGTRLAVGAEGEGGIPTSPTGSVKTFAFDGADWAAEGATLFGSGFVGFGFTVKLSGDGQWLAAGSPRANGGDGGVTVYNFSGGNWQPFGADLTGTGAGRFGGSLDLNADGSSLVVGAEVEPITPSGDRVGTVRTFQRGATAYAENGASLAGAADLDFFGGRVGLSSSGTRLVVGVLGAGGQLGEVRFYDRVGGQWQQLPGNVSGTTTRESLPESLALSNDGEAVVAGSPNFLSGSQRIGRVLAASLPAAPPLPVELTAFSASAKTDHVALAWVTAAERDASHFAVERSGDGDTWTALGEVTAAGDADAATDYALSDDAPLTGANYYRLRQVDTDGAEALSGVEVAYYGTAAGDLASVVVYPNPAHGYVALAGLRDAYGPGGPEGPGGVTARLLDVSGREVGVLGFGESEGSRQQSRISVAGLPSGVYTLELSTGTAREMRRVVVE